MHKISENQCGLALTLKGLFSCLPIGGAIFTQKLGAKGL